VDGAKPPCDFRVATHGTIWTFTVQNDAARDFADDVLGLESWQWTGANTFGVDHRLAADLVVHLRDESWEVEGD